MTEISKENRVNISKMNYKWRLIIILFIVLTLWGLVHLVYNNRRQPEPQLGLSDKIKISVHYEALCPDSKYFIIHQLLPLYKKIPEHISLDLIPYGKAKTIESEDSITFQCQHDEIECYANKIHACAIDLVQDPLVQLSYVACMIKNNQNPDGIGKTCAEIYDLDFTPILLCAKGQKGSLLLKGHGERTHALNPPVHFIPTVEFNNSQNLKPLKLILKNLKEAVCGVFKIKPKGCDSD
ncbi:hypothetical protein HHI36_023495 [Cryptolaemus montrouzieri]|uniref:Uncharacterized protein n=1 Tax=Cryptolaemus montrouzieri TaxID=559131 RepID=A0ABD2PGQ4_9CUCU